MRGAGMRSIALLFFFFLQGAVGGADELPALALPEVLSRIDAAQQSLKTVRLDFKEHWEGTQLKRPDVAGKLIFKRPHRLRIDQSKPETQVIVSDGRALRVFQPGAS